MADPPPGKSAAGEKLAADNTVSPGSTLNANSQRWSEAAHDHVVPAASPQVRLGPYELVERLGQGGMGAVWKARHTRLDKLVALKLLPPHLTSNPEAVERFAREMRAVGKLEHPHIVRAMDAGEIDGVHYLAMELVAGRDLAKLVKQSGPRPVGEACRQVREAALGLAHAHAHGMVHRDIKPSNLLLGETGVVKILDLGLARLQEGANTEKALTTTGALVGTPDFMAPEQWDNSHAVGPACDLYALGCTLQFLLTGHPPFDDGRHTSNAQKMKAHLLEPPPPLRTLRPDVPAGLGQLLAELLVKDPAARLASAARLAERLVPFTTAPAVSPALPATRDPAKRLAIWIPAAIAGGSLAVLMMLAVTWGLLNGTPDEEKSLPAAVPPTATPHAAQGTAKSGAGKPAIAPLDAATAAALQQEWASRLGLEVEYKNSLGMRFRLVPPGQYQRGTAPDEIERLTAEGRAANLPGFFFEKLPSEQPLHTVELSRPLYVGSHEVTQRDYAEVMGTNPAHYAHSPATDRTGKRDNSRHPVESVSWLDAARFCIRLSEREGLRPCYAIAGEAITQVDGNGYRLPTDAQWEFACRAGSQTRYWNGDTAETLRSTAWFADNSGNSTQSVGQLAANSFGLYDMHGNVWEWCQDGFDPAAYAPYRDAVATDPVVVPQAENWRIARGGSWQENALVCRSANRGVLPVTGTGSGVGFRVVLPVEAVLSAAGADQQGQAAP